MKMILIKSDLWKFVDKIEVEFMREGGRIKNDQKVCVDITSLLSHCATSKGVWGKSREIFQSKGVTVSV